MLTHYLSVNESTSCYSTGSHRPHRCSPVETNVYNIHLRHVWAYPNITLSQGAPFQDPDPTTMISAKRMIRWKFRLGCKNSGGNHVLSGRPDHPGQFWRSCLGMPRHFCSRYSRRHSQGAAAMRSLATSLPQQLVDTCGRGLGLVFIKLVLLYK